MQKGIGWPIGVTLVLCAVVAANIGVMMVAKSDPSFAVEPDYYRKGVAWDSSMAQAQRNADLGWKLDARLSGWTVDDGGILTVKLTDAAGQPVSGAVVGVHALFNARASEVHSAQLESVADSAGLYSARLPVRNSGEWELRFDVTAGDSLFTLSQRVQARRASSG